MSTVLLQEPTTSLAGLNLLVIDDDARDADLIRAAAEDVPDDIFVMHCTGPDAARRYLKEGGQCDLVLCDVEMPGENGMSFLRWMKSSAATQRTPVFMLSGHKDDDRITDAYQAGAAGYLVKPAIVKELPRVVRDLLQFWKYAARAR